jgi:hypothetical protein
VDSRFEEAVRVIARRFGADEVVGIEAMLAHKVVGFAARVKALEATERDILVDLRERIRQASKASSEELREVRDASLMS